MDPRKCITPFAKQCFVVIGASINMSQVGMVFGFAACLLPQLSDKHSPIPLDYHTSSWLASLPGFTLLLGNVTIPTLMGKLGRKRANIISVLIMIIGWSSIIIANNLTLLLVGRFFQGVSVGMSSCLTPIVIGEYTSPKNRGAFSMSMSVIMAAGTFTVHTIGSYVSWRTTALVCALITAADLVMVSFAPETPSWLADNGKYEECRKVFRWLRGTDDEDELAKMIEANKIYAESNYYKKKSFKVGDKIRGFFATLTKKEFYKPIIIMIHLYIICQWAGINLLAPYIVDLVEVTVGEDVNIPAVIISVGVQRIMSCMFAVFMIRRLRRRTMLFSIISLNAAVLLVTAGYVYCKENDMLVYDHPAIGGLLLHLLMITVATGSLPMPYAIAGEIFPLRYRSISGGISSVVCSINTFLAVKTFPHFKYSIGLSGAFCVYAVIIVYCLVVVWFLLPETKDRTLQDIEDDFKGKLSENELITVEPLKGIEE